MGQFLRTNGDYNIKAADGARITLDTGPGIGQVRVTGTLLVEGDTLTVSANDLNVKDNTIILNDGETGPGVTLIYSGIAIDRGASGGTPFATILWDDTDDTWNFAYRADPDSGGLDFSDSAIRVKRVLTDDAEDGGDLILIGTGTGVVKVSGTTAYENQVTDDDDIPNKKYVDDAIQNQPTFQIKSDDSRIIVADINTLPNLITTGGSLAYYTDQTGRLPEGQNGGPESFISVLVDSATSLVPTAVFFPDRVKIQDLEIENNRIINISDSNGDIILSTQGTGKVIADSPVQLEQTGYTPASVAGHTVIYSDVADIGDSGVWFVNDVSQLNKNSGELISKNKALLFSMIF
jgi:hypothetical protein